MATELDMNSYSNKLTRPVTMLMSVTRWMSVCSRRAVIASICRYISVIFRFLVGITSVSQFLRSFYHATFIARC